MLVSMQARAFWAIAAVAGTLAAQEPVQDQGKTFLIETGTRIPLSMVNSVSTKTTGEGDRVYLETTFPIAVNGKIVIPAGSYVLGTVMNKDPRLAGSEFLDIWDYPLLQSANVLICTHFHALVDRISEVFPTKKLHQRP